MRTTNEWTLLSRYFLSFWISRDDRSGRFTSFLFSFCGSYVFIVLFGSMIHYSLHSKCIFCVPRQLEQPLPFCSMFHLSSFFAPSLTRSFPTYFLFPYYYYPWFAGCSEIMQRTQVDDMSVYSTGSWELVPRRPFSRKGWMTIFGSFQLQTKVKMQQRTNEWTSWNNGMNQSSIIHPESRSSRHPFHQLNRPFSCKSYLTFYNCLHSPSFSSHADGRMRWWCDADRCVMPRRSYRICPEHSYSTFKRMWATEEDFESSSL